MEKTYIQESDAFETIDLGRMFAIVHRWAWLLVAGIILCAASSYFISRLQTPVYEAVTNILVAHDSSQQAIGDLSGSLSVTQLVGTYERMLSLDEFLNIVSQRLNYKVQAGNVSVTALQNTQVIELRVQDVDAARAALIADTMVVVLGEQNEALQAGRYAESQQGLESHITEIQTKIADVQAQLELAKDSVLIDQVAQAQANINSTVDLIEVTLAELDRLDKMTWGDAHFLLGNAKKNLVSMQASLDQQISERVKQEAKLSDPGVQADPKNVAAVQALLAEMDKKIEETRALLEDTQKEIAFLTPLDSPEGFDATVVEKTNLLATQRSLLLSYQNVYTSLLSTEEVKRTTNEIDNLEQSLKLNQQIYLDLLSRLEEVKNQKLQNMPIVEQVSPAIVSANPVKPRTFRNTLLGGLAGMILVGGVMILREMMDDTIKSREEVEKILGVKVLGYIVDIADETEGQGIYVVRVPRSPVAEAFRSLRSNLEFFGKEKPLKTILVTSSGPTEGKTIIAVNLAAIIAHSGKKVVLVDADLRRPRIHRYASVSNHTGLSDLLDAGQEGNFNTYIQKFEDLAELSILPSGSLPSNPTDLLDSDKMRRLLRALADSYDYVVIDSPPMLVADPQVLSDMADGILLVMIPGRTRKDVTRAAREQIQRTSARLLGVVFNRLKHSRRSGSGGYSYYYYPYYYFSDYYSSDDAKDASENGKKLGWWKIRGKRRRSDPPVPDAEK